MYKVSVELLTEVMYNV